MVEQPYFRRYCATTGFRTSPIVFVEIVERATGKVSSYRKLSPRYDLRNHSPDGFAWGYGGSGPSQLALALAADVLRDDERALSIYQPLKWSIVSRLAQDDPWVLTSDAILSAIEELERVDA